MKAVSLLIWLGSENFEENGQPVASTDLVVLSFSSPRRLEKENGLGHHSAKG